MHLIGAAASHGALYHILVGLGLSQSAAAAAESPLARALGVVVVVILAYLASRAGARIAHRALRTLQRRASSLPRSSRAAPRIDTLGQLAASTWRAVVWLVALAVVLDIVGINLTPVLAGATVVGAALGFGAQQIVRDFLAGFFILAEDQYGVGDTISVGDVAGVVEEVNLRVTRIRALDGQVWWVANGEIRKVANASIQWARAIVDVFLPPGADTQAALAAIEQESTAFADDPAWAESCQDTPEVWGVQAVDATGITVRVAVRTPALANTRVGRELRGRINQRLFREGVFKPPA